MKQKTKYLLLYVIVIASLILLLSKLSYTQTVIQGVQQFATTPNFLNFSFGGTTATDVVTEVTFTKIVTGIADNTNTTAFTISVPNGNHAALIKAKILASLGAGGAIGAFECSVGGEILVAVARTAGVAAVSGTSSIAEPTGSANVAGGATCTLARTPSGFSGAVTVTNTQPIGITIAHGSGASTNHQAIITISVFNSNSSGVTVS